MIVQSHDSPFFSDPAVDNPRNYAQMGPTEGYHDYNPKCACFACMKREKEEEEETDE